MSVNIEDIEQWVLSSSRNVIARKIAEKNQDVLSKDEQIKILKDALIFYSDLEELEETHSQLDWALVNNPSAIQDRGKCAREALKKIEELNKEESNEN